MDDTDSETDIEPVSGERIPEVSNPKMDIIDYMLENLFVCGICDERFPCAKDLRKHLLNHKRSPNDVCNESFARKNSLQTRVHAAHSATQPLSDELSNPQQESHLCDACGKSFAEKRYLRAHQRIHQEKMNVCGVCNKKFVRKSEVVRHLHSHSSVKPHACDICGMGYITRHALKMHHAVNHSEKMPFSCDVCGAGFSKMLLLRRHLPVHSDQSYACERCGEEFIEERLLETHACVGARRGRYACHVCDAGFAKMKLLRRHLAAIHSAADTPLICGRCKEAFSEQHDCGCSKEKQFSCDVCGKSYFHEGSLKRHLLEHYAEKSHACPLCDKRFFFASALKQHIRITHTKEKLYHCDFCSEGFFRSADFRQHLKSHRKPEDPERPPGERRFTCESCGRGFAHRAGLERHGVVHSGEKPFACDRCGRCFTQKSSLRAHLRIHSGEKPFVCGKGFARKRNLRKHHRIAHEEDGAKCDQ